MFLCNLMPFTLCGSDFQSWLSFLGRKKGSPLGIFSAQQVRSNTWGNRAARVGIIRIMIETLWICRYISVWKRMKSLWTLTWVQGFFPPIAYLMVRKQIISFLSCSLAKSPGQSGGCMIWVLLLLCWICIFLFQSTPGNERRSSKGWWKSPELGNRTWGLWPWCWRAAAFTS